MSKEFSTLTSFQSALLDKWAELEGTTKAELIRRFITDKLEWAIATNYLDKLAEEREKLGDAVNSDA